MAPTISEGRYASDWLKGESNIGAMYSREEIIVLSGQGKLDTGTLLGKATRGAASSAAKSGGNTGNGTVSAVTTPAGAKVGIYAVRFTAATTFDVLDPDGFNIGRGATGTAFNNDLGFTITAGGTPFVAGDGFDITVAAGSGKWKAYTPLATDGSEVVAGILLNAVDATSADAKQVAIVRDAVVNPQGLKYHADVDSAPKRLAALNGLRALGIHSREGA